MWYIGGPMTNLPQFNYPAFDEAARTLREEGKEILSPSELDDPATRIEALASLDGAPDTVAASGFGSDARDGVYRTFLGRDVDMLFDTPGLEGMYVIPGWKNSRGAILETFVVAALMGLPVVDYETRKNVPLGVLSGVWQGQLYSKQAEMRNQTVVI